MLRPLHVPPRAPLALVAPRRALRSRWLGLYWMLSLSVAGLGCPASKPVPAAALPPEARQAQFWSEASAILAGDDPQGAYLVMEAAEDLRLPAGAPLVLRGLTHEESQVRARAARAYLVTQQRDPAPLRPLLDDPDLEAQLWGAGALASLGDATGKERLERFVADPRPFLDATAAAGEEPGGRSFREGSYLAAAGEAMSLAGLPGAPVLARALASSYPQVRYPAALALLRLGDTTQATLVQEGFAKGFLSPRLAVYLYEATQDPAALDAPASAYADALALEDQAQAVVAAWALAKAGVAPVRDTLLSAERAEAVELRFLARWALLTPKTSAPPAVLAPERLRATPGLSPASQSQPASGPHDHHNHH